jgi:hypothetical protein
VFHQELLIFCAEESQYFNLNLIFFYTFCLHTCKLRPVLVTGLLRTLRLSFPRRRKSVWLRKILHQFRQRICTTAKTTTPIRTNVRLYLSRKEFICVKKFVYSQKNKEGILIIHDWILYTVFLIYSRCSSRICLVNTANIKAWRSSVIQFPFWNSISLSVSPTSRRPICKTCPYKYAAYFYCLPYQSRVTSTLWHNCFDCRNLIRKSHNSDVLPNIISKIRYLKIHSIQA